MGARSYSSNTEGIARVKKVRRCSLCQGIVGHICDNARCPHPKVESKRKPILHRKPKQSRLKRFINLLKGRK